MHICVYCASSQKADPVYREAAFRFGELLADGGHTLVYGGGGIGSMGAVANGVLSRNGKVVGIIPRFLLEREMKHKDLTELVVVEDMHERKYKLLHSADAVVALPGGCGTLDELFETMTLKRLGRHHKPIILLNTKNFYGPLETFMRQVVDEHFMTRPDADLWHTVAEPEDVLPAVAAQVVS